MIRSVAARQRRRPEPNGPAVRRSSTSTSQPKVAQHDLGMIAARHRLDRRAPRPSRASPASRIADLTCAEAGTLRWSIPPSPPPWSVIGRWSPPLEPRAHPRQAARSRAPSAGRDSEASPVKVALDRRNPAAAPISSRAAVPLNCRSRPARRASAMLRPSPPSRPAASRSTLHAKRPSARAVASTSSLSSRPVNSGFAVGPGSAARISARCEQHLSPGMAASPLSGPDAVTVQLRAHVARQAGDMGGQIDRLGRG